MKTISLFAAMAMALLGIIRCAPQGESTAKAGGPSTEKRLDPVKRGEYLVGAIGCDDCHSPKIFTEEGGIKVDMDRRLSGHPANEQLPKVTDKRMIAPGQWVLFSSGFTASAGPWGVSFAANLTPDPSGIGDWTYQQFEKAIREGKHKGLDSARNLLPPMPWEVYRNLTDDDLRAIYSYLKTIKPVQNVVPAPVPPTEL